MLVVKPINFDAVRAPGILGMLLFAWAAFKHASRYVAYCVYAFFARGTVVNSRVYFRDIAAWNSYVAPVFVSAFWWLVVALVLTAHYLKLVQYLGFAHLTGMTFSWTDILTSKAWTFGPFGASLVLAIILIFAMLADLICACVVKVGVSDNAKMNQFLSSSACVWIEGFAAVLVGLLAGYVQVSAYYTLFDMAFASAGAPDSLVFATLVRLGHWLPAYGLIVIVLAIIFAMVAEMISNSMNADENRGWMKLLWAYAPTLFFGILLCEMLYWGLVYDVLCIGTIESWMLNAGTVGSIGPYYWSEVFGSWAGYQAYVKSHAVSYITYTDLLWTQLINSGYNPIAAIFGSIGSGLYVVVSFVSLILTSTLFYLLAEIDAVLIAGLNSLLAVFALIALPLVTPIAWAFLLAITGLELAIALLQAYVFITLSSMYLNDVIKLH